MSAVGTGKGYLTAASAADKLYSHLNTAPFRTSKLGTGFQRFTGIPAGYVEIRMDEIQHSFYAQ